MIYALTETPALAPLLGAPLEDAALKEARQLATTNGAVPAALAVARDHAKKAREALTGADKLDASVTAGLARLVDDLVDRNA